MRDGEGKTTITTPPIVRSVEVRVQVTTVIVTIGTEEIRTTVRIVDGVAHCNNPPETHLLDFLVREFLADEAGNFRVRLFELPLFSFSPNVPDQTIVVTEEHTLEDSNFSGDALGRFEVLVTENAFGVTPHVVLLAFKAGDPFFASRAIAGDREVDNAVLFTLFCALSDICFPTEQPIDTFISTVFVPDRLNAIHCLVVTSHFFWFPFILHIGVLCLASPI